MKLTEEQKLANKQRRSEERAAAKRQAKDDAKRNQPPVSSIIITVKWRKNPTWGWCPRAIAAVRFRDGKLTHDDSFYASGCGYDKCSTVVASVFNKYLAYKLYRPLTPLMSEYNREHNNTPYGIHQEPYYYFDGGIGTDCYYDIALAINGKFRHVSDESTIDVFEYIDEDPDENC